ncbi:glycerate kinase [Microbacterium sp. No. 7]|uniref:glycerate kinase n=1 Tax=Microbacterium sp. No. 7 TaxID=1714373 RepID=UPI0006CFE71F|nr:glycerate kinase [Microbacterium sp. No. 7]ALJ18925.1 glycerate kinase [Microbacterium sp. No. 7]
MSARVVVAVDGFKGSITAADAAAALADGWGDGAVLRPMADGGEGTLDAFAAAVPGARRVPVTVRGPHDGPVAAHWLLLPDGTGVVELASTSGIELLSDGLRPWDADTLGFGQAIAAAIDAGVSRLVLGIGSSASTDGGAGMLRALGARVLDAAGSPAGAGLRGLCEAASVDLDGLRPLPPGGVRVLSDVTSPLCGPAGAAAVFGPQKGLDAEGVAVADAALARWAGLVGVDPAEAGAGAAGGTGFALLAWGGRLEPGAPAVAELIGLDEAIAGADLVVTGEGSYDASSAVGKVPALVAERARCAGVPVALVAGRIADDADLSGFAASVSLTALAGSADAALRAPAQWLRTAAAVLRAGVSGSA